MPFDRSLLPAAQFEFVVVSDTHYMLDQGDKPVEFSSRLKQSARAFSALKQIATLNASFVVHLGDLVQEYPDTAAFPQAIEEALAQIEDCGLSLKQVAGNHDVGDKPDPTMPTSPVTRESLDGYHARFGPSWYAFDQGDCRFVVLNSQIMNNSGLPESGEQRQWLETELAEHAGRRLFLFLHLPPYLWNAAEPALGHYENLDQPDRGWLLDLIERHAVERVFAGHVHTSFFDRIGPVRYFVANSTSFTRPGFCHMFTSGPLPERGRDDAPKLGFYLVRVCDDRSDLHFLRSGGVVEPPAETADNRKRLVTRVPATFSQPRLGVTLRQALAPVSEVPLAWPAAIREPIRNDFPLLALCELGATCLRTQYTDLAESFQCRRLAILRDEGVQITATTLWSPRLDLPAIVEEHGGKVDAWEIHLPGSSRLSHENLQSIGNVRKRSNLPLALSAVVPGEIVAGKQHPRTRWGFRSEELRQLNQSLADADVPIDRVICGVAAGELPWNVARQIQQVGALSHINAIDLSVELATCDDLVNAVRVADALFAAATSPSMRVYFDPLVDLDRSMDTCHGLLDTICNPRPAFHVARCLNTILFGANLPADFVANTHEDETSLIRSLVSERRTINLLLPRSQTFSRPSHLAGNLFSKIGDDATARVYRLVDATVSAAAVADLPSILSTETFTGPLLVDVCQA